MNRAADIGAWVRAELTAKEPDTDFILRVIARETDRWFNGSDFDPGLVEQPVATGSRQWDALIEGVVAYRMNLAGFKPPEWTYRTSLEVGWNPREPVNDSGIGWAILDMFETPAELLEKGVTFSRRNMDLA